MLCPWRWKTGQTESKRRVDTHATRTPPGRWAIDGPSAVGPAACVDFYCPALGTDSKPWLTCSQSAVCREGDCRDSAAASTLPERGDPGTVVASIYSFGYRDSSSEKPWQRHPQRQQDPTQRSADLELVNLLAQLIGALGCLDANEIGNGARLFPLQLWLALGGILRDAQLAKARAPVGKGGGGGAAQCTEFLLAQGYSALTSQPSFPKHPLVQ